MEDKARLRILAKELCHNVIDKHIASIKLLEILRPLLDNNSNIAIYHACASIEISLFYVIEYLLKYKKNVYQPIAYKSSKVMRFELVRHNNIDKQIFYPDNYQLENEINLQDLDLILLPLLAVDKFGARLGKGGGYYDSTLKKINKKINPPLLIGVGFNCQMLDMIIPVDAWDIHMDYFANDVSLIKF